MLGNGAERRKVAEDPDLEEEEGEGPWFKFSAEVDHKMAGLDCGEDGFTKEVQLYRIIGAKSPFQFWMVKETSDEKRKIFTQSKEFSRLQFVMRMQEISNYGKVPLVHLEKHKLYLTFDNVMRQWHRARLLQFNRKRDSVLVYFVDFPLLQLAEIPVDSLRELPEEFCGYPVVTVYKCYLYDVIPSPSIGEDYGWGNKVKEWFVQKVNWESVWVGIQMEWRAKRMGDGPDWEIDLGVVLFEDDDRLEGEGAMSLNYNLVRMGHAKGIGVGATHYSNLFLAEEGEPLFSLEHIPELANMDWCSGKLPDFLGKRWPQVVIRSVKGPTCIYVTLKSKYKEYLGMQWKLEEIYKDGGLRKINRNFVGVGLGCLVGFKNMRTGEAIIYRCVVVGVNGSKTVEVLLVDVGEIKTVPVSTLYVLPKRVKLIPAFVHRIHLKNLAPPSCNYLNFLKWTGDMEEGFNQFVGEIGYGEGDPAWFAVRLDLPYSGDVINLREVCQDLTFDKGDKQWICMSASKGNLDSYEGQVMIKNHLHSIGVDLVVLEGKGRGKGDQDNGGKYKWGFESLAEIVAGGNKERFEGELVGRMMNKEVYYDGLLIGAK